MALLGIKDKVVLITGASGSIGSGTAEEYAQLGARLALTGRDQDKLRKTAEQCESAGANTDQILTVTGDITKSQDVMNIVKATVTKFGRIDILVNCAGVIRSGAFLKTKMDDYETIFDTNTKGTFLVCQHAAPHIIESKGSIVNLSNFTGIKPAFSYFAYAMAAAALDQFTKALSLELGPKGVRVNSVNPGVIQNTDSWTREGGPFSDKIDTINQLQEGLVKMYPLRRLGQISDVAHAITFLSSDNASFVHGVTLPVDGGKVLTAKTCKPPQ